jgi:predicted nucleic acid-binding protein
LSYLIDTNILSELRKRERCDPNVAAWYASTRPDELFLSVLVLGEVRRGADRLRKRDPAQARAVERWLILAVDQFGDRLLHVDRWVAEEWGRIDARTPVPPIDGLLAATAQVKGFTLVTRNVRDIARTGVPYLNPFEPRQ